MRIGIIGAGFIGGTLGRLWAAAGHTIRFGSRNPSRLAELVAELGAAASAGSHAEAVRFADVVFTAAPYGAWPDLAGELGPLLRGKILLDAANPFERDGAFASAALAGGEGAGVPVARLLPGVLLVRAFNAVYWETLRDEAHRPGERLAIPLAGDNPAAVEKAARLVCDAGFDPVIAGPLVQAAEFDVGAPAYDNPQTAQCLERTLALQPPG